MEDNKVIVIFLCKQYGAGLDIEIPLNITANELLYGLNQGMNLGINMDNPEECYLRMENPVGFLRGDTILSEYGIRNGSVIYAE